MRGRAGPRGAAGSGASRRSIGFAGFAVAGAPNQHQCEPNPRGYLSRVIIQKSHGDTNSEIPPSQCSANGERQSLAHASVRSTATKGNSSKANRQPRLNGTDRVTNTAADRPRVAAAFENKAGRYELIRVTDELTYYSFTNRQGKTVDATMSVIMWQRMHARAGQG